MSLSQYSGNNTPNPFAQKSNAPAANGNNAPGNPGSVPPKNDDQNKYASLGDAAPTQKQNGYEQEPQGPQSPLDKWEKLFNNDESAGGGNGNNSGGGNNQQQQQQKKPEPEKEMDMPDYESIQKTFSSRNLAEGVDKELLAKAQNGDPEAFQKVLAQTAQNAASQATFLAMHGSKQYINDRVSKSSEATKKETSTSVRVQNITDAVIQNNEKFAHPMVKGQVSQATEKMMQKFPQASPREIATSVEEYMNDYLSYLSTGQQNNNPGQKNSDEMDWEQFTNS